MNRYNRCLQLSSRISEAELSLLQLEKRYLPKWPKVIEAQELLNILKTQFSEELEKVLNNSPEEMAFWEENFDVDDTLMTASFPIR